MAAHRSAIVLAPEQGEALWCAGALSVVKAGAEQTAGAYSLIEDLAPRGSGPPSHRHDEDDEAFFVLEGEITVVLHGGDPLRVGAGGFIHIPGGTVHAFQVDTETARYLIITTPQHEQFYRAIADPALSLTLPPEMAMDTNVLGAACAAYKVESVDPAADGDGRS